MRVEEKLGVHLVVPPQPQITAALGAALVAAERPVAP
jgi:activator of 2-hydroxyglutaryl-CoA dehydratase